MALHSISGNFTVNYNNGILPNIDNDLGTIRGAGNITETSLWVSRRIRDSGVGKINSVVSGIGGAQEVNNQGTFGSIGQVIQSVNITLAGVSNTTFRSPAANAENRSHSIKPIASLRSIHNQTAIRNNRWDKFNAAWDAGAPKNVESGIYNQNTNLHIATATGVFSNLAAAITGIHIPIFDDGTVQSITTNNDSFAGLRFITARVTGLAADVGAVSVIVSGTDFNDDSQSETLPAYTVNETSTRTGILEFKTVHSWQIPIHSDVNISTSLGYTTGVSIGDTASIVDNAANPTRIVPGEYLFLVGGSNFVSGQYDAKNT